jgi:fatty acid desaturase/membrane-associated phospholipid phosphatase
MPESARIKAGTNWALLATSAVAAATLLWTATHGAHVMVRVGAAIAFGFVNNTIFSLLHEAVHRTFDPVRWRNAAAGHVAAWWFPTSLTVQRAFHMTHHTNNRGEEERFDFLAPGEHVALKVAQWFCILTGVYGISAPVFALFYSTFGVFVPWSRLVKPGSQFATQTSAHAYLDAIVTLPVWRVRAEVAAFVAFHLLLAWALSLSWSGWLLCYVAYAITWSSQQYANHAYSVLDRDDGAWNIQVGRVTRWLFLNYHDHLAHHQDTGRPWHALPTAVHATQPSVPLLDILYLMWTGPRLLPGAPRDASRLASLRRAVVVAHVLVFGALFIAIYGSSSLLHASADALHDVATRWDALVPFVPASGLLYLSLTPLLLTTAFILRQPERTLPFVTTLGLQLVVAWCCFQLMPVALPEVPVIPVGAPWHAVMRLVDVTNLDGNGLPSLHVAFAVSCAWVSTRSLSAARAVLVWLWAIAIVASTLLTKQHFLVDVVAGLLLAGVTMMFVHPRLTRALARIEAYVATTTRTFAATA